MLIDCEVKKKLSVGFDESKKIIEIMIRNFIFCFALLLGVFSYAQLPSFTLSATPTLETCYGNGTVKVTVDGVADGAGVDYVIYKLPDNTLLFVGAGDASEPDYPYTFTGLPAGDYRVVATQSLGGASNVQEDPLVTVLPGANHVSPLTTEVTPHILCVQPPEGPDGTITVTLNQGTAQYYRLLKEQPADSGTFVEVAGPQGGNQNSTVFTDLTPGHYRVVIRDAICDNDVVITRFIDDFTIPPVVFGENKLTPDFSDCDNPLVTLEQGFQVPRVAFPLTITFTVYPPDGSDPIEIVLEDVEPTGGSDPVNLGVEVSLPYFPGEEYFFNINVTNQCGAGYSHNSGNMPVFYELEANARLALEVCYGIEVQVQGAIGGGFYVDFLDREDYFNGIETIINVGHISNDPLTSAIVQKPIDQQTELPYVHPGPYPASSEGAGTVIYGVYDMVLLDENDEPVLVDGEKVPVLVGDYVIKVRDMCVPPNVGYFEDLSIIEEISEPNVNLVSHPPLPSLDPFLDCITVGEVYINHILYLNKGENQEAEFMDQDGNIILPGKVEIIDGPADFKYFLNHYNFDATRPEGVAFVGENQGIHLILDENNPIDITSAVGLHPSEDANPPNPEVLSYGGAAPAGTVRAFYPGLVGEGEYKIRITDICGNTWDIDETLEPFFTEQSTFSTSVAQGCDEFGSVYVVPGFNETIGTIQHAIVSTAPDEFYEMFGENSFDHENPDVRRPLTDSLGNPVFDELGNPVIVHDLGQPGLYWFYVPAPTPGDPGAFHMAIGGLPKGEYQIDVKAGCALGSINFTIEGYEQDLTEFDMQVFCGNFNFKFDYTSNSSDAFVPVYALERCDKYNVEECEESDWVQVQNITVTPGQWNTGVSGVGNYRIVKYYDVYDFDVFNGATFGGLQDPPCKTIIHEFSYFAEPGIKSIDVIACPNGDSVTVIDALGAEPLRYQLVEVTVAPDGTVTVIDVLVDNGEDNTFLNLEPGEYYFRIIDNCDADVVGVSTVGEPIEFKVIEDNLCDGVEDPLCDGNSGCLSVNFLSVLEYKWVRVDANGVETPVLDENGDQVTGNQLHFTPYSVVEHAGIYRVYMTTDGDLSFCDVNYIEYELTDSAAPYAGDDRSVTECHTDQVIDLFSLFESSYDLGGNWEDVDNTGALTGNVFNTELVANGTYTFRYFITGCSGADESFITITLIDVPLAPIVDNFNAICEGEDLEIEISGANPQYTYIWTLPNGNTYTSTDGGKLPLTELTIQEAGNYSVIAVLGDCISPATTVAVVVKPSPEFTITSNTEICTTLTVVASNFTASDATYSWTLAGNVVGTNAILVADENGEYLVTVTLDGCTTSQVINVTSPSIVIEYGCVDNQFMISVSNVDVFPNATYSWEGPEGFTDSGASINISGQSNGVYTVTVTDSEGCTTSGFETITGTQCMIPKGVSPNGDGLNDTFDLSNFNVNEVKIFNRYGRIVFDKSNGYTNEWHGQSNNDGDLPTATYYYHVTFVDGTQKTGWVYLNRED